MSDQTENTQCFHFENNDNGSDYESSSDQTTNQPTDNDSDSDSCGSDLIDEIFDTLDLDQNLRQRNQQKDEQTELINPYNRMQMNLLTAYENDLELKMRDIRSFNEEILRNPGVIITHIGIWISIIIIGSLVIPVVQNMFNSFF